MHETAVSIAGVDLNLLRLDGRPIAWAYNYRCDGRIEMQRLRATGEFSSLAACVLLGRMLHDGFRRRDESYLFDRETSRTAGGWQTGRATRCRHVHYSRIGAGRGSCVCWRVSGAKSQSAAASLERITLPCRVQMNRFSGEFSPRGTLQGSLSCGSWLLAGPETL